MNQRSKQLSGLVDSKSIWWIYGCLAATTLYFNSKIKDPFNSPKMWIIIFTSAWLLGHILSYLFKFKIKKELFPIFALLALFITNLLISAFTSDSLYRAFFGENLRRNGFMTYLSLTIIMIATFTFVRINGLRRFFDITYFIGSYLSIYGWLQSTGRDFIEWNNPYNAIIGTVGNPNFAASLMAIVGLVCAGGLLTGTYNITIKLSLALIPVNLIYLIYKSDSRQGLIISALGYALIAIFYIYSRNKLMGKISILGFSVAGIYSVLGMLQIGPLAQYLYKASVTVRGYYWQAGVSMFKDNPLFGVGVDSYGSYFKEFRNVEYPLKYGFNITSTNAHNTPIQFFATSGFIVGFLYLAIQIFVLYRSYLAIKKYQSNDQLAVVSIFAAWVAFQAQSLISIDNIGISIWGWILGGLLIGLSINDQDELAQKLKLKRKNEIDIMKLSLSVLFIIPALAIVIPLYRAEASMLQTQAIYKPEVTDRPANLYDYSNRTLNLPLLEPAFKLDIGVFLTTSGFTSEGLDVLNNLLKADPRNQDLLSILAEYNEQLGDVDKAVSNRLDLAKYDPWNAANYFRLGLLYKSMGDQNGMQKMLEKINSFASLDPIADQARIELGT